jgi:hypothetical protein
VVSLTHDSRPVKPIQASDLFVPKRALVICIVAFAERTVSGEVDQDYRIELRGEVLHTFKGTHSTRRSALAQGSRDREQDCRGAGHLLEAIRFVGRGIDKGQISNVGNLSPMKQISSFQTGIDDVEVWMNRVESPLFDGGYSPALLAMPVPVAACHVQTKPVRNFSALRGHQNARFNVRCQFW